MSLGTPLPALYWATDKVGGPESMSVTTGKPMSSQLQHGKLIQDALVRLVCLVLHVKLSSRLGNLLEGLQEVVWAPTRSLGPTNRSTGLLVGRTHLSRTTVSLVDGDQGYHMSH
jgi:hypothetical protein